MRGLYAIVDVDSLQLAKIAPVELARAIVVARPPLLQLRAKSSAARDVLALLRELVPICHEAGTLLVANDRPDLALLAGADFVHVGQHDLGVRDVRRIAPALRVGISTHTPDELARALADDPDYVAYGPVFATRSKANPDPVVGLEGLADAARAAAARNIPLVAIGGIDRVTAASVARHAQLGAVISALLPESGDITESARALHRALGGAA